MLGKLGLSLALAVVGAGAVVLVFLFVGDLPGRLVGYGLGVMFIGLAALLVGGELTRSSPDRWTEPGAGEATGRPRGVEWVFVALMNAVAAALTAAGIFEARSSGDPGLLVASGIGWLCFVGPTAGFLRRWRGSRR